MFDDLKEHTALIQKKRPDWQAGFLNGIGGKIESGESPLEAMVREFKEETGVDTAHDQWQRVVLLQADFQVYVFRTIGNLHRLKTMTDENIVIARVDQIGIHTISNLRWLIPFCLDTSTSGRYQVHGKITAANTF